MQTDPTSPAPSWYELEARGLRETFLAALPSVEERERMAQWACAQFERMLERDGFAHESTSALAAILAAAGRDLLYLSSLLHCVAEEELADGKPPAVRRQRSRVRQATRALDRLAASFEQMAAQFEAEAVGARDAH